MRRALTVTFATTDMSPDPLLVFFHNARLEPLLNKRQDCTVTDPRSATVARRLARGRVSKYFYDVVLPSEQAFYRALGGTPRTKSITSARKNPPRRGAL